MSPCKNRSVRVAIKKKIPVGDSDFFFVPRSHHVDQFTFHHHVCYDTGFVAQEPTIECWATFHVENRSNEPTLN